MCGRYSITTPVEAMRRLFGFDGLPNLGANYNVAPTSAVPIVRLDDQQRAVAMARWGLVPSWAKEIRPKPLINARAETVSEKPAFQSSFRRRRCLVPADGYYEWKTQADGTKQPYYIHRRDGQMMGFAGIWSDWMAPDGSEIDTMAILTAAANNSLKSLHHRMPVMIGEGDFDLWLDTSIETSAEIDGLLRPADDELLNSHPVSRRVNRVGIDDPSLIDPIELDPPDEESAAPEDDAQLPLL